MPIQIQDIHDQEDSVDCPLCMETLEVDDINFFPCECGYQICRFCWHRIRTDENGLCPACRKAYPENPAEFKPLSEAELQKIRLDKKQKEVARKQKITDSRKHLANVRVLQKNLVFVVGLSQRLADVEVLKRQEYFGKYGKILKVVLNSNTSYAGTQTPSCSAYVTYSKVEESLRAIQSVNNVHIDGRTLKASLGTTKYCSNYLKNQVCQKHDCMYLHEIGDEDASFTKEDMQLSKHQEYEQKLIQQMIQKEISQAQEMRNKSLRQEANTENGGASAGSSPPTITSTITQGLSVAQAVKKNVKMTAEASATNRPRRHSSSTSPSVTPAETISETDFQNKNTGKAPRLSASVGDRDSKSGSKPSSRRNAGKKNVNIQNGNQAPRHKKQQQQQANSSGSKKIPSRAHSASPSTQNSQSESASEHSPPASMPISTGPSVESSPAVTPIRDVTTESNKPVVNNNKAVDDTSNKIALRFSEESQVTVGDSANTMATLPIDIPLGNDGNVDKSRDTPLSDTSSIDRKSPFIRDNLSQDSQSSVNNQLNSGDGSLGNRNVLTKSRFMMLHKAETGSSNDPFSRLVSNSLGYSPFGMASDPAGVPSTLLQDLPTTDNGMAATHPTTRSIPPPPPGLTGIQPNNSISGWPTSNPRLSDSMPIKSSNDWEAAFGFKTAPKEVVSSADDDLGFDPWLECSKGLADLMEKEKTQEIHTSNISSSAHNFPPNSNTSFHDLSTMQRRPTSLHNPNMQGQHPFGYSGGTDLINGFSNLLSNAPSQQHKMPFQYDNSQQRQFEQSRFLQQQRLSNPFAQNEQTERNIQQLLGSVNGQKQVPMGHGGPPTPNKEQTNKNSNITDWQNGLRALLPSVNINFATQGQSQRPTSRPVDSSLGLSSLGMPMEPNKQQNIPHPPGISNSSMNPHPLFNKPNVMPPPGVGFPVRSSSFMPSRQQWGGPESSMSTPGMPSNRLVSPASLQSLFAAGHRSESNPMPGSMQSYPPDPAIIQGGMPGFGSSMRRNRLFENTQNKSPNMNSNNSDEQPHWMKSLQALTEPDSPVRPIPSSNNNSNMNQLFSQRQANNGMSSWPGMPGLFSNSGFGPAQPPPGFQVRPSLSKPTEFGMIHNLLENQS